jgi:cytochrome b561
MTTSRKRFAVPQRLLHWLMAICILSMLFIGVGMVSTAAPKYLTLVQIHKPLVWRCVSTTALHRYQPTCRNR